MNSSFDASKSTATATVSPDFVLRNAGFDWRFVAMILSSSESSGAPSSTTMLMGATTTPPPHLDGFSNDSSQTMAMVIGFTVGGLVLAALIAAFFCSRRFCFSSRKKTMQPINAKSISREEARRPSQSMAASDLNSLFLLAGHEMGSMSNRKEKKNT